MQQEHSQRQFRPDVVSNYFAPEAERVAALLPGLQSAWPETRIRALYVYRAAFESTGIQSEEALLAAAGLVADREPEVRKEARQILIEVDSRRPAVPALPLLLPTLRQCADMEEALDLGRTIGCMRVSPVDISSPSAFLIDMLGQSSDVPRAGAARAADVIIGRWRMRLDGVAAHMDVLSRDAAEIHLGQEILDRIQRLEPGYRERIARSCGINLVKLKLEYEEVLKFRPALAEHLLSPNLELRRAVSHALRGLEADCRPLLSSMVRLFKDADHEVRGNAFDCLACCPNELAQSGDLLVRLLLREREVTALGALTKCVERHPCPPPRALALLRQLADLPENEPQVEMQHPGNLVIGSGFVASRAQRALQNIQMRLLRN